MKKLNSKILSLFALLLGSCATTYQEEGFFTNGYSNKSLTKDTFVITYHANEMTRPDKVVQLAIRRCAQVAGNNGYRYFTITEHLNHQSKKKVPGLHYPSVQLTIRCFKESPSDTEFFDANNLL